MKALTISATQAWSPFSAASTATCAIEFGLLVDCDWMSAIAVISFAGPQAQPMRQPVIE